MARSSFIGTAWNNGSHHLSGAGYGLKISQADRDVYFQRGWKTVKLYFESFTRPLEVNIDNDAFWKTCSELRGKEIGQWLIAHGLAPWPKQKPPKFRLAPRSERAFEVMPL